VYIKMRKFISFLRRMCNRYLSIFFYTNLSIIIRNCGLFC